MKNTRSVSIFEQSKKLIPGGVNSPVRAFRAVGMNPIVIKRAKGSKIIDVDENEYIDYVGSWGPMILGNANDEIIAEIKKAAESGTSYGAPTEKELEVAKLICGALPSIEMVRMVNSGTEAVMSAIRLARGYTGRNKILKFDGCYHGHSDGMLVKAGSGLLTAGVPNSAGVPEDYVKNTLTASYNNCEEIKALFNTFGNDIAAAIVEPVAANMGVVPPDIEFLKLLRKLTEHYGALLIFDEVITGFRISYGGAQEYYGIRPDITTFGKIIGGGMPVGAYGGRSDIMRKVSPEGPVYQAGTLSGNPVAMAAGCKTLEILRDNPSIYLELELKANRLKDAFIKNAHKYDIPIRVNNIGSIMSVFFTDEDVYDYKTAVKSNTARFAHYFCSMLEHGIYIAPSQFEALFISDAHSDDDIARTIDAIDTAFSELN